MKKTKMLALTLVVAIMLVGAGYAAWTDQILQETVIDTGEFNVKFSNSMYATTTVDYLPGTPPGLKGLRDNFSVVGGGHNAFIITHDDDYKTMNFRFHNAYPGTRMGASMWARNYGTLPAVIDQVIVDYTIKDEVTNTVITNSKLETAMLVDYNYYIQPHGTAFDSSKRVANGSGILLADLNSVLNTALRGKVMLPGEEFGGGLPQGNPAEDWAPFNFTFRIPSGSLFNDEAENEILELSITYKYVQHNMYQ